MSLLTVGLNHHTAPLSIREAIAFPADQFAGALEDFLHLPQIREGAILSTCNRSELYAIVDDSVVAAEPSEDAALRAWLCHQRGLDPARHAGYFYILHGREVVRHSLRVAAGLDSMILGEPQILGQMKDAYRTARAAQATGPLLSRLFEHSFAVAKDVRSSTGIGANPVSAAYAGVSLARRIFTDLQQTRALLIGAGETIELTARHLAEAGVRRMIFANRSPERAHKLAAPYQGQVIALAEIPQYLAAADLLVASTGAAEPLVRAADLQSALHQRRRRPMFVLDLAVPRDIEPAAADSEDIYLYTVDDLQSVVEENLRSRRLAANRADAIIDARIEEYLDWVHSRAAVDTIRTLRGNAEAHRAEIMAQARRRLARGDDAEAVLEFASRRLTNKLMHAPSATLRKAGGHHQWRLLGPARELFGIDDPPYSNDDNDR
jgi:glutamyl-tRNA reductase